MPRVRSTCCTGKEIDDAENPPQRRQELIKEYTDTFANPLIAAGRGMIDDIIEPAETRLYVAQSLEVLKAKRETRPQKKHGLIPL